TPKERSRSRRAVGSGDDAQDVAFLHDEQVIAVDLDLGAGPLSEEDAVAGLDVEGGELAGFIATTGTHSDDLTFLRLLLDGIGDDDAAFCLLLALEALDDDAVVQRSKCHVVSFLFWLAGSAEPDGSRSKRISEKGSLALAYIECQQNDRGGRSAPAACQDSDWHVRPKPYNLERH